MEKRLFVATYRAVANYREVYADKIIVAENMEEAWDIAEKLAIVNTFGDEGLVRWELESVYPLEQYLNKYDRERVDRESEYVLETARNDGVDTSNLERVRRWLKELSR